MIWIFLKFKCEQQGIFQKFEVWGPLVAWRPLDFSTGTNDPGLESLRRAENTRLERHKSYMYSGAGMTLEADW